LITVLVPGSKSLTNRALVAAALGDGTARIEGASPADDCRDLVNALRSLGVAISSSADGATLTVTGSPGGLAAPAAPIAGSHGGTTTRFLVAVAALCSGETVIDGSPRMRERPILHLVDALRQLGVGIESPGGRLPVRVRGGTLRGGCAVVRGDVSSQFLSALLLIAPCALAPTELVVPAGLSSRPYVEMTIETMKHFGADVAREGDRRFLVLPTGYRSPAVFHIEADASSASYFLAVPALLGGAIRVSGVSRSSRQADVRFLDVLEQMGCSVSDEDGAVRFDTRQALRGIDVDLTDSPDIAQTLAVIAPFATGPTTVSGIASARLKECDRVAAVCRELGRLGVDLTEHGDGFTIRPCRAMRPGIVRTYGDHRMAMAFALLGLRVPGIVIDDPACVSKSFPAFFQALREIGRSS
jgi:3-phosphoshikimate 1-carboxyvinyltransferase